jgi:hypothetical protein
VGVPAVHVRAGGALELYALTASGRVKFCWRSGAGAGQWHHEWTVLPGTVTSAPVAHLTRSIEGYARGKDAALYMYS